MKDFILFQFHYGTIRWISYSGGRDRVFPFQFHYGTIRWALGQMGMNERELFQFHYGTIRWIAEVSYVNIINEYNCPDNII